MNYLKTIICRECNTVIKQKLIDEINQNGYADYCISCGRSNTYSCVDHISEGTLIVLNTVESTV